MSGWYRPPGHAGEDGLFVVGEAGLAGGDPGGPPASPGLPLGGGLVGHGGLPPSGPEAVVGRVVDRFSQHGGGMALVEQPDLERGAGGGVFGGDVGEADAAAGRV